MSANQHRFNHNGQPRLGMVLLCLALAAPFAALAADRTSAQGLGGMGLAGGAQLGGFSLHPQWSVDTDQVALGYTPVNADESVDPGLTNSNLYSLRGVTLSGTGTLPINQGLSLFGKLGVLGWDKNPRVNGTALYGTADAYGLDMTYGAGGKYVFGANLSLHAEWDRYTINQNGFDLFSAGLHYNFK